MATLDNVIAAAQPGLMINPSFGRFLTFSLTVPPATANGRFQTTITELNQLAATLGEQTAVVTAVNPTLWQQWYGTLPPGGPPADTILNHSTHFRHSGGDFWLYLKGQTAVAAETLQTQATSQFAPIATLTDATAAWQRDNRKILDHHFYDGITSPTDPVTIASDILLGNDTATPGGSWLFTQKFQIDWPTYLGNNIDDQESIIGRNAAGAIIPNDDNRSHIRRARIINNAAQSNPKLLRLSLPYGNAGSGHGREQGIYFVAFANDLGNVEGVLRSMAGNRSNGHDTAKDKLLNIVQGLAGGYWYVPSAHELQLPYGLTSADFQTDPHWATRSQNGLMFYNATDYTTQMGTGRYAPGDPPTPRILGLLGKITSRWRDNWYRLKDIPRIPHLQTFLSPTAADIMTRSVAIRRGYAIKTSLTQLHTNSHYPQTPDLYAWQADQFRLDPQDILFGVMPELSLGRGKEVMPFLTDEERLAGYLMMLDESSPMGHIVPNHNTLLQKGIGALLAELVERKSGHHHGKKHDFYQSAIYALEGVQGYLQNYAQLAENMANDPTAVSPTDRPNLLAIAARARKLATDPPTTFLEATQLIFVLHCCLHLAGNPVSVGRLDQLLAPFYERDTLSDGEAQEIIDAFWLKLGEKAIHNRHHATDHVSYGTTAVSYIGGNFPQGGGINQWVQQVTVGGYLPTADPQPTPGANPVTLLCLRASRRLPLNAPCLSLRIYPGMDEEIIQEAARALLSGGAHPILFHEERMITGLNQFSRVPLADARNYACDGCYEPMVAGATEFAFSNVAPLDALELSLNQGATYGAAGPVYLRGLKQTFRSPHAADIHSFEQLQAIYLQHLTWLTVQFFHNVLVNYGNVAKFAPSPLLSSVIDGCLESGRDLSNGGARYHFIAPMFVGLSTTIDSLAAIQALVFSEETAVTTLPELLDCLQSDWGYNLQEPMQSTLAGAERAALKAKRYKQLRQQALALPKFGMGNPTVDAIGHWLVDNMCEIARDTIENPPPVLADVLEDIAQNYGVHFHMMPGIGTFEGYVGDGLNSGASADGRRSGQPYPSDFSPAPVPQDLDPIPQQETAVQPIPGTYRPIYQALSSWNQDAINHKISNAAPVDMNIHEDFPLDEIINFIHAYCNGDVGSNLLTMTCVDPAIYQQAMDLPEKYEFVRVRMGGWTEFFAATFPQHQEQHRRRPFFTPQ